MHSAVLGGIDFSRYQRWLDRAIGSKTVALVFDRNGNTLWGGEHLAAQALGQALVAAGNDAPALQRYDLDVQQTALCQSLGLSNSGRIGWMATVVDYFDEKNAPVMIDHLAEIMADLAIGIGDEYRQKADLEMMTEELGARYEELHLFYAVNLHEQALSGENTAVFQSLLQSTAEYLNVDIVAFVRPGENICQYATSRSEEIHNLDLMLIEMRGDLYRFVQASGETIVMNDAEDPRRNYIFTDMPYKVMACPVQTEQRVNSLIVLVNHNHKSDFSNSDRKLAEVLAQQLSSLSNTHLLIKSMSELNQQMAMALIEAVEAKDPYTRGHSERVNYLSMEIGRALELPADELDDLHWGSLLHDVGKIGIPDAVLCKPSQLSKDERTFVMVHPERSYEILRHIKHLDKAVLGARHHHELYGGNGYPHGLKGERIPLAARIIAIADTYDSITSSRAYRARRSHEMAMTEIEKASGTQLDPALVNLFKRLVATEPEWLERFNIQRDKS